MHIDVTPIIANIKLTESEIRPIKKLLRRRWAEPMAAHQQKLVRLKRRATELYVLRAHVRGRRHALNRSAEWHDRVAGVVRDAGHDNGYPVQSPRTGACRRCAERCNELVGGDALEKWALPKLRNDARANNCD